MSLGRPRNHGCRISDEWQLQGMRTLILENELLRVVVLLDKGSDIIEFRYKPHDLDVLYFAPGGLRNPARGIPSAYSQNPFIDYYSGGWNEVLPNGGPFAVYRGAEMGQHGEINLLPWEYAILEDAIERVSAKLWVRPIRTPFFIEKTLSMEPGKAQLVIKERLVNESGVPLHAMWGQHIAFGREFLGEGAVINIPARQLLVHPGMEGYEPRRFQPGVEAAWPMVPAPDGSLVDASRIPAVSEMQAQEMAYITGLSQGWYTVTNPLRRLGFGVTFDPSLYRYVWYWQQLGNVAADFPWWGRTHTTALEPWTSYPTSGLPEAVANGSALQLPAGQEILTTFTAFLYEGLTRVDGVTPQGEVRGAV